MTTTVTIIREIEITVGARYIPGTDATYWQPSEADNIEIFTAYDADGLSIELTEAEVDEVREMVLQDPPQPDYDEE